MTITIQEGSCGLETETDCSDKASFCQKRVFDVGDPLILSCASSETMVLVPVQSLPPVCLLGLFEEPVSTEPKSLALQVVVQFLSLRLA